MTNDTHIPEGNIIKSYQSIHHGHLDFYLEDMYWLSWKGIYQFLKYSDGCSQQDNLVIQGVMRVLERKNLVSFEGFSQLLTVDAASWQYNQPPEL
ncbi:hypothetical protein [Bacillus sp. AK031]